MSPVLDAHQREASQFADGAGQEDRVGHKVADAGVRGLDAAPEYVTRYRFRTEEGTAPQQFNGLGHLLAASC